MEMACLTLLWAMMQGRGRACSYFPLLSTWKGKIAVCCSHTLHMGLFPVGLIGRWGQSLLKKISPTIGIFFGYGRCPTYHLCSVFPRTQFDSHYTTLLYQHVLLIVIILTISIFHSLQLDSILVNLQRNQHLLLSKKGNTDCYYS